MYMPCVVNIMFQLKVIYIIHVLSIIIIEAVHDGAVAAVEGPNRDLHRKAPNVAFRSIASMNNIQIPQIHYSISNIYICINELYIYIVRRSE